MSNNKQTFIPMLAYENGEGMMDWLIKAFGLVEKERWMQEGRLEHGELTFANQVIMLATPTPDYQCPMKVRENYAPAAEWSKVPYIINGVLVHVANIDEHLATAVAGGATILSHIQDGPPGRSYRAEDPEGQRWFFLETH
jgi:uncharacterized glyoxalase superfamily protein PhnB